MNREQALSVLESNAQVFVTEGVAHLALFGSVARDEARADSDVDLLVEFEPDAHPTLVDLVRLQDTAARILGHPAHLTVRRGLRPERLGAILLEARQVF